MINSVAEISSKYVVRIKLKEIMKRKKINRNLLCHLTGLKLDTINRYYFEKLFELLESPIEKIKLPLILAGNNMAYLNEKSEFELRNMIFEYVKLDPNDINKVKTFDKGKLSSLASKMGISLNELYSKLGVSMEEEKEVITSESNVSQYLYQTEQLFQKVIDDYLSSTLPANEKAEQYVERVNYIYNEFRNQVLHTNGFVGSDRYKEVINYIKALPNFKKFEKDEAIGDYINQVNEKKYYEELSKQIDQYMESLSENNSSKLDI